MKVHNFAGFTKTRGKMNESEDMEVPGMSGAAPMDYAAGYYGANPEEGEEMPEDEMEDETEGEEEEEVTLEDLKAMIEDLTERIEKLEGGEEEEEEEPAEGEEGEEPAEGEEEPAK